VPAPPPWLAAAALLAAALALDTAAPAADFTPLARSPLVSVEGAVGADSLTLRLRRPADGSPLAATELTVSVDGRALPATAHADGSWTVPLAGLPPGTPGKLELVIAHEGMREVLSGTIALPAAQGGNGFMGALMHKQMAWWILNIAVVLIGVIAISRRMS
jgi:hypothetical protein